MVVCFYFQLHQPYRVRRYRVFDIGSGESYFAEPLNRETLRRVADRCYSPATEILAQLVNRAGARFALSVSGVALEQLERDAPYALEGLQRLVSTGGVELLGETMHHSLSALEHAVEFTAQVAQHRSSVQRSFGVTPRVFRNTELITSDAIAARVAKLGFSAMLVEGADRVLDGRSPNHVYASAAAPKLRLLPRNYRLSDDIAFRFSDRAWSSWPLTADRYADWIAASPGDVVNIFMDGETFGEHHAAATGIFDFLHALPAALERSGVRMVTPSALVERQPVDTLSYPTPTSWADTERDTSAWLGNRLQRAAHDRLYQLRDSVLTHGDADLIATWQRLSTSDHFYYMATKWQADGDVHRYFSPHATPYDAYISYMNVLRDLEQRTGADRGPATPSRQKSKRELEPKAKSARKKAVVKAKVAPPKSKPAKTPRAKPKSKPKPSAKKR